MFTQIKLYLKWIFGILFLIACLWAYFATITAIKNSDERKRLKTDLIISNQKLDSTITNSGKKDYTINQLTLKKSELEQINSSLINKLDDANIKLKKVSSITQIEYQYKFVNDTFLIAKEINDTTYKWALINKWINISQNILFKNNHTIVGIDSLHIGLKDTLLLPYETIYKGWWFWKKPAYVKVHAIVSNPYYKIDNLYSINLLK